jgi:hypothetical protein
VSTVLRKWHDIAGQCGWWNVEINSGSTARPSMFENPLRRVVIVVFAPFALPAFGV